MLKINIYFIYKVQQEGKESTLLAHLEIKNPLQAVCLQGISRLNLYPEPNYLG